MSRRAGQARMIQGGARMDSGLFSNRWRLRAGGTEVARLFRFPHHRMSVARLDDGTEWRIEPDGWGRVEVKEDGEVIARVIRRSWLGRLWDLESQLFGLQLRSHPLPRRWAFEVGSEPVAFVRGSLWNYNHLQVDAPMGIPLAAVLLAWQVVVRPWEAAAYPLTLRPAAVERAEGARTPPPRPGTPRHGNRPSRPREDAGS